jgi:hypothetical protein
MVRNIVDRCVELILPDPKNKDRALPLGWVMSVERIREIVSSRLASQLGDLIGVQDKARVITTMHLVMAFNNPLFDIEWTTDSKRIADCNSYWYNRGLELATVHKAQILANVNDDPSLMSSAYQRNWITLTAMDGWPLRPWHFLFMSNVRVGIGEAYWLDPASALVRFYACGESIKFPRWSALEEVLDIIKALGAPPWDLGGQARLTLFPLTNDETIRPLDSAATRKARTAAFILLAILAESQIGVDPRRLGAANQGRFGHLRSFEPYIQCRELSKGGKRYAHKLKMLDVDEGFQDLFNAWATGQVDLSLPVPSNDNQ